MATACAREGLRTGGQGEVTGEGARRAAACPAEQVVAGLLCDCGNRSFDPRPYMLYNFILLQNRTLHHRRGWRHCKR